MDRIVKTFFQTFLQSLFPQSKHYSKIIKASFSLSFTYFLTFLLAINIGFIVILAVKYNPQKIYSFLSASTTSLSRYPKNLAITIQNASLITNYNRPYLFWFDFEDKKNLFLVVDETADQEKIKQYGASFLLTSRELITNNTKTGVISSIPLNYIENQTITKGQINKLIGGINTIQKYLPFIYITTIILLLLFTPLISFLVTAVYIFFASLLVFLVFKVFFQRHFHFKKIIQVSLHAITFPLTLDYVIMLVKPAIQIQNNKMLSFFHTVPPPMLFLIILGVFVAIGVYEAHEGGKVHHKHRV